MADVCSLKNGFELPKRNPADMRLEVKTKGDGGFEGVCDGGDRARAKRDRPLLRHPSEGIPENTSVMAWSNTSNVLRGYMTKGQ